MTRRKAPRKHARLGCSNAARWIACPPSVAASAKARRTTSAAAEEGTFAHAVLEACLMLGYEPGQVLEYVTHEGEEVPEEVSRCVAHTIGYVHRWQAAHPTGIVCIEHELNPGALIDRDDLYGTADLVLVDIADNSAEVLDYKHGRKAVSATDNPQLKLYALGVLREFFKHIRPIRWGQIAVKLVIIQPRVTERESEYDTNGLKLLRWLHDTVIPAALGTYDEDGPRCSGPHCHFCPAAGTCRELTQKVFGAAALEFAPEEEDKQVPRPPATMTPEEVAHALSYRHLLQSWLDTTEATAINLMLDGYTLPGQKLVYRRKRRAWADEDKVAKFAKLNSCGPALFVQRLLTVRQAFIELKKAGMPEAKLKKLAALVKNPEPEVTVAPEGDNREVVKPEDYGKFKEMDHE